MKKNTYKHTVAILVIREFTIHCIHLTLFGTPTFSATAFMCHHNTFLVYQSMRNATMERWEKVTHLSVGFAWLVAACFGIAGYCTFRALSQGTFGGHTCSHIIC